MPDLVVTEAARERIGTLAGVDHSSDRVREPARNQPSQTAKGYRLRDRNYRDKRKVSHSQVCGRGEPDWRVQVPELERYASQCDQPHRSKQ